MTNRTPQTQSSPNVSAVIIGWLLPGLGHMMLGQRRRGFLIMFGILFLVLFGVLVGGIDAVDHTHDGLWFIAQIWCGVVVALVDLLNHWYIVPLPISEKANLVGLSHANEIGTLFIAMAGLMNFVVLLDLIQTKPNNDLDRRTPDSNKEESPC